MMNLSERERSLLGILVVVLVSAVLYLFLIEPLLSYAASIEEKRLAMQQNLAILEKQKEEYQELQQRQRTIMSRLRRSDGVTAYLEQEAGNAGILDNKTYTRNSPGSYKGKYKKTVTDMKYEGVSAAAMLAYISKIESSGKLLDITYLRFSETMKDKNTYDVTIKMESYSE